MPLTKFICPLERIEVDFDHFEHCTAKKGRPAFPPWLANAIAIKEQSDVRHKTLDLTATRTFGCPRQVYIETQWDFSLDPSKLALRARGSAMHEIAEKYWNKEYWMTEKSDPIRMTIDGVFAGYKVSMLCDVLRRDMKEIVDMKFSMDFSVKWRDKSPNAKMEHALQLNLARHLLAQQDWATKEGYDPDDVTLTIWDHAIGYDSGPKALHAPHMSEDQMLAKVPFGGKYTVGQILEIYEWMQDEHMKMKDEGGGDEAKDRLAASLPLVGLEMMRGSKCTKYCDVEKKCSALVSKYGEPEVEFDG